MDKLARMSDKHLDELNDQAINDFINGKTNYEDTLNKMYGLFQMKVGNAIREAQSKNG